MHESRIGGQRMLSERDSSADWKRGQAPFAGTALRVLRTKGACPLFLFGQVEQPLLGVGAPFGCCAGRGGGGNGRRLCSASRSAASAEALLGRFAGETAPPRRPRRRTPLAPRRPHPAAHAQLPTPAVDHRSIEIDQPLPSLGPPAESGRVASRKWKPVRPHRTGCRRSVRSYVPHPHRSESP